MRTIKLTHTCASNLNALKGHLRCAEGRAEVAFGKWQDYVNAMEFMDDCDDAVYEHRDNLWFDYASVRDEVQSIKEDMLRVYLHCDA